MYTVQYQQQVVQLREAESERRRLEEQLNNKDKESRLQEEDLMKLRSMYTCMSVQHFS